MQKAWIVLTRAVSISRSSRSQSACSSSLSFGVLQPLVACVADAGPHFAGGRVGERDRDELAEPGRVDCYSRPDRGARGNRSVRTCVLPQPAPAESATETSRVSRARSCSVVSVAGGMGIVG